MPKYDIAVLGTGLNGLFAAEKLSRAGKKVILFDAAPYAGGKAANIHVDGTIFPVVPVPTYGFEPGGRLNRLCAEAGIPDMPLQELQDYQVLLPRNRITVFPSREATFEELEREFPEKAGTIKDIYLTLTTRVEKAKKSAMSSYLLRRSTARDYLKSRNIGNELFAFFDAQSRMLFGSRLSLLRLDAFGLLLIGRPHAPVSGYGGMADRLCQRIVTNGGVLRLDEPWPTVVHRSKRITELQTGNGTVEAGIVVLNAIDRERDRRFQISMPYNAIPEEMRSTLCCLPDAGSSNDLFTVSTDTITFRERNLIALTIVFSGSKMLNSSRSMLLDHIAEVMPFFHESTTAVGEEDPKARVYPLEYFPDSLRSDLAAGRGFLKRAGFKNLYLLPDGCLTSDAVNDIEQLVRRLS